jgi:OOP family OmpA-OmpF porin
MMAGLTFRNAMIGGAMALGASAAFSAAAMGAAPLLPLPGPADQIGERQALLDDLEVPVGPWRKGEIESIPVEGQLLQTSWRIDDTDLSTLQLMKALRADLAARGYEVLYECQTRSCGGFDFRFNIHVLPEPEMHVDLGDFRFLSARRVSEAATPAQAGAETGAGAEGEYVTLMVSRSYRTGFVQMTQVTPPRMIADAPVLSTRSYAPTGAEGADGFWAASALPQGAALSENAGALAAALERGGAITLDDLKFDVGSTRLGPGPFPSLERLAEYLLRHPDRRVTLVGHTDALGGLDQNIVLSRKRAEAVMAVLAREHGVPKAQIEAAGVGYLAPRASNLTDDGRGLNRRVEVVLTSLE